MASILTLLWNPGNEAISAGGFRRTKEILERHTKDQGSLIVLDSHPSFMRGVNKDAIKLYEYFIPSMIKKLERDYFTLERILEWKYAVLAMFFTAVKLRREFDVVYVPYSEIAVTFLPAALIKFFLRKKIVLCNLNTDDSSFTRPFNNFVHNHADKVFTISKDLAKGLGEQGIKQKMEINYTGLDVSLLNKIHLQKKQYDAIFIGRHVKTKGIYDYLAMLPEMVKKYPDFKFASIGACTPDIEQELKAKLAKLKLTQHWDILGIVDEAEKYRLIKSATVMWFLSTLEGWGIAPQEALACGTLPICYDLPVYKESIRNCQAATFVKIGDWKSAVKETIRLRQLSKMAKSSLVIEGKEFVKRFDWEEIAKREFAIIASV